MKSTTRYLTLLVALLAVSGASRALGQNARARDADTDPSRVKLNKVVQLDLGPTTVDALAASLSTQTGLAIKAADYLRERKLIVRMKNLSASEALDALADLNDWTWYRTLPDQILITPRRLRMDATAAAVPRMMQAAIPRDIRTFMNVRTPNDDMSTSVNPLTIRRGPGRADADKLYRTAAMDKSELLKSLAPQLFAGETISYAKLNEKQRYQLVISLIFPLLSETDERLLHTDILPHVADVNNAVLSMSGETTLIIGSEYKAPGITSSAGIGVQVR